MIGLRPRSVRLVLTCLAATAVALAAIGDTALARRGALQISTQPSLYPGFDPGIGDYVIRCDGNPVAVHVSAPPDREVSVDGQPARTGTFDTQVNVSTGQKFAITEVGNDEYSPRYYVRCLPTDFPRFSAQRSGTPQASFYITTPTIILDGHRADYLAIFDTNGVPMWWTKSAPQPIDATLLPDGNIVWSHYPSTYPAPDGFEEHRLDGSFVRQIAAVGTGGNTDFHDLQQLRNGDYLVAAAVGHTVDETPCGGSTSASVSEDVLQQVRPDGSVVWSWDTADHIPTSEVDPTWYDQCRAGDPYHWNTIEAAGNNTFLISYRHLNAIYKVDMSTGNIVWKLGGVPTLKSLTLVGDPNDGFSGQHDIRTLGDGTVTLYDNETRKPNQPRAVRYRIDEGAKIAHFVEQVVHPDAMSSRCCGSARKLLGGDYVTSWGANTFVTEQTASGRTVFRLDFDLWSYRAQPVGRELSRAKLRAGMDAMYPRWPQRLFDRHN